MVDPRDERAIQAVVEILTRTPDAPFNEAMTYADAARRLVSIAEGDKVTIEKFPEVDPVTRKPLANLKQFVAASPDTLVPKK